MQVAGIYHGLNLQQLETVTARRNFSHWVLRDWITCVTVVDCTIPTFRQTYFLGQRSLGVPDLWIKRTLPNFM
jgi:hypothetical protein